MPKYMIHGYTSTGKIIDTIIDASCPELAAQQFKDDGNIVLNIKVTTEEKIKKSKFMTVADLMGILDKKNPNSIVCTVVGNGVAPVGTVHDIIYANSDAIAFEPDDEQ